MTPYYQDDATCLYLGDCREVLPAIGVESVSLVVADPPYFGVVEEGWDNQWDSEDDFLSWLRSVIGPLSDVLADNGTVYLFCSSRMNGRVEAEMSRSLAVIANCVWCKGDERSGVAGTGIDVTSLRTFWSSTNERCVVAEKKVNQTFDSADESARVASGYWSACEAGKRGVFGDYMKAELEKAGATQREIAALFPSKTGRPTGCVSNWLLGYNIPTPEQYQAIREYLNRRAEGDYLRKNYEDLRKNYEDLRRPFFATSRHQWGEIWRFGVQRSERQHPTQKPEALIGQLVSISSRAGDVVLDPFMGSGTTLVAAKRLGRKAIGIEVEERYCEIAAKRLSQGALPLEFTA